MAISHADHDHPNTPAARAKCRKAMANVTVTVDSGKIVSTGLEMAVVPRKRGDGGVVRGMIAAKPLKRFGTLIKADYDLADVPRMLAYGVRLAWAADWDVRVGDRFNEEEARIVIEGDKGTISLVWRDKRPDGIWAIWVKNYDSSKQFKVDSVQRAMEIMTFDSDAWDEYGNLVNG